MSGTVHILASSMSGTAVHRSTSVKAKISFCFRRVYKLTMLLNTVDSDTTNQKRISTRTKPSVSTRTPRQFHATVTPLPHSDDASHAVLTLVPRSSHAAMTPLTPVPFPSHAAVTRLTRRIAAAMTQLPRRADAPITQR